MRNKSSRSCAANNCQSLHMHEAHRRMEHFTPVHRPTSATQFRGWCPMCIACGHGQCTSGARRSATTHARRRQRSSSPLTMSAILPHQEHALHRRACTCFLTAAVDTYAAASAAPSSETHLHCVCLLRPGHSPVACSVFYRVSRSLLQCRGSIFFFV